MTASSRFLFALATLLLLVPLLNMAPGHAAETGPRKAKLIGVLFHADWCRPCHEIDGVIEDISNRFDGEPILGIVFDLTDLSTRTHSEMLASALGLDELWRKNGGQLGTAYLLDAETKEIIESMSPEATLDAAFEELSAKVEKALAER